MRGEDIYWCKLYDKDAIYEAQRKGVCVHCNDPAHTFHDCPKKGLTPMVDFFFYKRLTQEEHRKMRDEAMRGR